MGALGIESVLEYKNEQAMFQDSTWQVLNLLNLKYF